MTKNKPVKAIVAIIKIGDREIEGLEFPDGTHAISIAQIWRLFEFSEYPKNARRDLKRLMGKDFSGIRCQTELNSNKAYVVDISTFEIIMAKLDRKGNKKAQDLRDILAGLSVKQLFSDAFNQKFEKEERQQWLASRQQSKLTRRTFTDVIKDYVNSNSDDLSDNYKKFIYNNCSDATYRVVFGRSAKKLKEDWDCKEVREALTIEESMIVQSVERLAKTLIDDQNFEPQTAIKEAGNRLLIKKIER